MYLLNYEKRMSTTEVVAWFLYGAFVQVFMVCAAIFLLAQPFKIDIEGLSFLFPLVINSIFWLASLILLSSGKGVRYLFGCLSCSFSAMLLVSLIVFVLVR